MILASLDKFSDKVFMDEKKEREEVDKILEELRIKAPSMETQLVQLSGGN